MNQAHLQKSRTVAVFAVFGLALIYRLWGIENSLSDFHHFRQTYTALFARFFYRGGMNLLEPEVGIYNYANISEFQLYPFVVAALYHVFGEHAVIGRLVSVVCSMITMALLYLTVKRYYNRRAAIFAALFFAILPMMVYYSRTFMLESMLVMFCMLALYGLTRYLDGDGVGFYFLGVTGAALAMLVKIPAAFILLPMAFLFFNRYGLHIFLAPSAYLFAVLAATPAFIWYYVFPEIFPDAGIFDSTVRDIYTHPAMVELYKQQLSRWFTWYKLFFDRIGEKYLAVSGFLFLMAAVQLRVWDVFRTRLLEPLRERLPFVRRLTQENRIAAGALLVLYIAGGWLPALLASLIVWLIDFASRWRERGVPEADRVFADGRIRNERGDSREQLVFYVWILGVLAFVVAFIMPNLVHDYYQLPILPPACALIGGYLDFILRKHETQSTDRRRYGLVVLHAVLVAAVAPYSIIKVSEKLARDSFYEDFGRRVQAVTEPDEDIAYIDRMPRTEALYFADRKGYIGTTVATPIGGGVLFVMPGAQEVLIHHIEYFHREGARYMATPYVEFTKYFPIVKAYMDERYINLLEGVEVEQQPGETYDSAKRFPGVVYDMGPPENAPPEEDSDKLLEDLPAGKTSGERPRRIFGFEGDEHGGKKFDELFKSDYEGSNHE